MLCRVLVLVCVFVSMLRVQAAAGEATEVAPRARPGWYMGRQIAPTMSADGAGWLIRKSRETEEQPQKLLKALGVKPGQIVCDFGCGNGYHTLRLAHRVGPRGRVYAVDIQEEMLELLQARAEPRGITNIELVLATDTNPKLPTGKLDMLLMVDVYHELFEPQAILEAIHSSLNETGRMVLVEFREEDPTVPIRPLHKMSQAQVIKEITANRFKLVEQFDELPWQHVLLFARTDSRLLQVELTPWQSVDLEQSAPGTGPESSSGAARPAPGN
ncbi:MAG: class I SAM-dependent methyltransferase [Bythopirellula sp.]